ncbi:MAG: hypothetical protein U0401_28280 [Anaerolineae bacterium]
MVAGLGVQRALLTGSVVAVIITFRLLAEMAALATACFTTFRQMQQAGRLRAPEPRTNEYWPRCRRGKIDGADVCGFQLKFPFKPQVLQGRVNFQFLA